MNAFEIGFSDSSITVIPADTYVVEYDACGKRTRIDFYDNITEEKYIIVRKYWLFGSKYQKRIIKKYSKRVGTVNECVYIKNIS